MAISGPGPVQGGFPVRPTQTTPPVSKPTQTSPISSPKDELEISSAGRMMDELQSGGGMRAERLAKIKAAIDAGEYETADKLEAALDRMLAEFRAESSD